MTGLIAINNGYDYQSIAFRIWSQIYELPFKKDGLTKVHSILSKRLPWMNTGWSRLRQSSSASGNTSIVWSRWQKKISSWQLQNVNIYTGNIYTRSCHTFNSVQCWLYSNISDYNFITDCNGSCQFLYQSTFSLTNKTMALTNLSWFSQSSSWLIHTSNIQIARFHWKINSLKFKATTCLLYKHGVWIS